MATTKERIFVIADKMDANGQNPTLALVRKHLAGGSFTTISEAMTEWKTRKSAKEGPSLREPPPPPLTERFSDLGGEIWSLALDLANRRLKAEREALEITRLELEAGKTEAAELADQVTAELEVLQRRVAAMKTAEETARSEAYALTERLTGLAERAATAEARAAEIERRADDLNIEFASVNEQNYGLVKALTDSMERIKML